MPPAYYPRLHRLSTLNLIYHGSFDYQLNPWCTSFAGESGVGKSMIADLLQLIFVGKDEYKSATQAKGARPPEGLVLDDARSEGKGLGYAFLTVEVDESRFIVVGCYLAAAAKSVVPFIVQQGFDFSKWLAPLHRPLSYLDFLPATNQVLPPPEMLVHLQQRQQVTIKFFDHRISEFHRILFFNEILPLDVNQPGVLKNYAKIIRSFSRSGELTEDKHKKKDELKNFLFGEEAKDTIWRDYKLRVEEISAQLGDHQTNTALITSLTEKLSRFRVLYEKRKAAQQARETWLLAHVVYRQGEVLRAEATLAQATMAAIVGQTQLYQLEQAEQQSKAAIADQTQQTYEALTNRQVALASEAARWQRTAQQAQETQHTLAPAAEQARQYRAAVAQALEWLRTHGTLAALHLAQRQQQSTRRDHELLTQLDTHLAAAGQTAQFQQSGWSTATSAATGEMALNNLREQVAASRRQHVFSDLDNPDSLASWAFLRKKPLTVAEESILTHFGRQAERQAIEAEPSHYLHTPDELFANALEIVPGQQNAGGWLQVRGVRVWVPLLAAADCAFTDTNQERIKNLFAARQQAAQRDLTAAETQLQREEAVWETLQTVPGWQQALEVNIRREAVAAAVAADLLPETSAFLDTLAHYQADATTRAAHETTEQQVSEAIKMLTDAQSKLAVIASQAKEVTEKLAGQSLSELARQANEAHAAAKQAAQTLADWLRGQQLSATDLSIDAAELADLSANTPSLYEKLGRLRATLAGLQTTSQTARTAYDTAQEACQQAEGEYTKQTKNPTPPPPTTSPSLTAEPDEEPAKSLQTAYEREFDILVDKYLSPSHKPLSYEDELSLIIREVLPDVVHEFVESEEALALVAARLQNINETHQRIAGLKIQLLRNTFEEVRTAYYAYIEEAKKIKKYFLDKNAQITGGFRPELTYAPSREYPIDWINIFGQMLNERSSGTAAQFAQLSSLESLEELMRKAYLNNGGEVTDAKATDLLNPKSYLELSFDMRAAKGRINQGSTGQTFMAAALLNIARLSVIGGSSQRPGIRLIPVDEAHGLGSNYTVLLELARQERYQVISLSVGPMIDTASAQHRVYFLGFDPAPDSLLNLHPMMLDLTQKLVPAALPPPAPTGLFDDATN